MSISLECRLSTLSLTILAVCARLLASHIDIHVQYQILSVSPNFIAIMGSFPKHSFSLNRPPIFNYRGQITSMHVEC